MTDSERASALRKDLKSMGYNARKVSVRCTDGAIHVTVKTLGVDYDAVEKAAEAYSHIHRCDVTHEILSGGNTFVFVAESYELEKLHTELAKDIVVHKDMDKKITDEVTLTYDTWVDSYVFRTKEETLYQVHDAAVQRVAGRIIDKAAQEAA